jgi:hypothetical protein
MSFENGIAVATCCLLAAGLGGALLEVARVPATEAFTALPAALFAGDVKPKALARTVDTWAPARVVVIARPPLIVVINEWTSSLIEDCLFENEKLPRLAFKLNLLMGLGAENAATQLADIEAPGAPKLLRGRQFAAFHQAVDSRARDAEERANRRCVDKGLVRQVMESGDGRRNIDRCDGFRHTDSPGRKPDAGCMSTWRQALA